MVAYLFLEAGDLVAFGVDERALGLTGDDITGLLGQGQQLTHFLQTLRLTVTQLFLHGRTEQRSAHSMEFRH